MRRIRCRRYCLIEQGIATGFAGCSYTFLRSKEQNFPQITQISQINEQEHLQVSGVPVGGATRGDAL